MTLESIFRRKIKQLYKQMGPRGWWPRLLAPRETCNAKHQTFRRDTLHVVRYTNCIIKHHPGDKSHWLLRGRELEVWEVGIGSILTQNTNWSNVEKAILNLVRANEITPEKVSACRLSRLESLIRSAGYYKQKALKLKEYAKFALSLEAKIFLNPKTDPEVCHAMLLSIWGIGPETADNIVLYGLDKPVFVVDAYTRRLLVQLSGDKSWLTKPYEEVRRFCEKALARYSLPDISSGYPPLIKGERGGIRSRVKTFKEAHALIVEWGKHDKKEPAR